MPQRRIGTEPSFRLKLREDSLLPSFYESRVTVTLLRARHTPAIDPAAAAVLVCSPSDLALQTAQLLRFQCFRYPVRADCDDGHEFLNSLPL